MLGISGRTGGTGRRMFGIVGRIGVIGATSVGWPTDGRMFGTVARMSGTGGRMSETGVRIGEIGGPAGADRSLVPIAQDGRASCPPILRW